MTTATARFDDNLRRFFGETEFSSPFYLAIDENPWRLPYLVGTFRGEAASAANSPADLIYAGLRPLGKGTRRSLLGNPNQALEENAKKPGALAETLKSMKQAGLIKAEVSATTNVPADVQKAASLILSAAMKSVVLRRLAVKNLGATDDAFVFLAGSAANDEDSEVAERMIRYGRAFDLSAMGAAAFDMALAISTAQAWCAAVSPTLSYKFEVETTWGVVRLSGGTNDTWPDKPTLLSIDTGGNDTYLNFPRTASGTNWVSCSIDSSGDDAYVSDKALSGTKMPAFAGRKSTSCLTGPGGALLGLAYLVDCQGTDTYRSHLPGIGSGRFGMALVWDMGGNDIYDGYRDAEGHGHFGLGVLLDKSGDDTYDSFASSQGSAYVGGAGLLVDQLGKDKYTANDTDIDFGSPQDAKHNVSMSQGAATGRRADYSDGHSLAGGWGLLLDQKGDDQYSCGVFGQGVGYWQGIGILSDSEGTDSYKGIWYVQGASAHFAVGALEDEAGDDTFVATTNMAQGAGHDFSVGLLFDGAGNDTHTAPNLSLGAGNANGIGLFVDQQGNDSYVCTGLTLGKAAEAPGTGLRAKGLCLGLFMDLGGIDKYPQEAVHAGDARRATTWTRKAERLPESQVGVFYDR